MVEQEEIYSGFVWGFGRGRPMGDSRRGGCRCGRLEIYLHLLPTNCKSASLMHWPIKSIPYSAYTTSQNFTPLWFPHWPPWMWRISHIFTFFFVNCFSRESDGKLGGKICRVWESLYMFVIRNLGVLCEGFCLRWVWCWLWLLMVKSVVILIVVWLLCSY